jgi:hypothetical protein
MKRTAITLIFLAILAAACGLPVQPAPQATQPAPAPTDAPDQPTPQVTPPAAPAGELTEAEAAALAHLAEALGVPPEQITLVRSEAVEWPDSCLGISYPNARCAQAITPGFRIVLEAAGATYEIHTDQDGRAVAAAVPSLTWHREGGIAGFCDDLYVSGFGEAQASSCRSGETYPAGQLTEAEREQLNEWGREFGSVVIESTDPAVSDAMTYVVTMTGGGTGQPTEAEQQEIIAWAEAVYDRLRP